MRNIEIKARFPDLSEAREIARRLGADDRGLLIQTDTYFFAPHGRLKLREIEGASAELIAYERPDRSEVKLSNYELTTLPDPRSLKRILTRALGVRVVVRKRRELWYLERTRLHLDQVDGLGSFFEFEVEVTPDEDEAPRQALAARLRAEFGLSDALLVAGSYADLLETTVTDLPISPGDREFR